MLSPLSSLPIYFKACLLVFVAGSLIACSSGSNNNSDSNNSDSNNSSNNNSDSNNNNGSDPTPSLCERAISNYLPITTHAATARSFNFNAANNTEFHLESVAGKVGENGNVDGKADQARFDRPTYTVLDSEGNLYVSDGYTRIRKIAPDGTVSTFVGKEAGYKDGDKNEARFGSIWGMAIDEDDNIYVADNGNSLVRKITPSGQVSTFAGTSESFASEALESGKTKFSSVSGLALDSEGNLFVSDRYDNSIYKIGSDGQVKTFVRGSTLKPSMNIAIDKDDNLYVVINFFEGIQKITPSGEISTFWEDKKISSIAISNDNHLYAGSAELNSLHKINLETEEESIVSAHKSRGYKDGSLNEALFDGLSGIAIANNDVIFIADSYNYVIRKIEGDEVTTIAGEPSYEGELKFGLTGGYGIALNSQSNLYVVNAIDSRTIDIISPNGEIGSLNLNDYKDTPNEYFIPRGFVVDSSDNLYISSKNKGHIKKIAPDGEASIFVGASNASDSSIESFFHDAQGTDARFKSIRALLIDASDTLFVVDESRIRTITSQGVVSTLADSSKCDNDNCTAISFSYPSYIAQGPGGDIYIADTGNNLIRKVDACGEITTIAGDGTFGFADGVGTEAKFALPEGIAVAVSGNIYVADTHNHVVRRLTQNADGTYKVSTLIGTPGLRGTVLGALPSTLYKPSALLLDANNNLIITTDKAVVVAKDIESYQSQP